MKLVKKPCDVIRESIVTFNCQLVGMKRSSVRVSNPDDWFHLFMLAIRNHADELVELAQMCGVNAKYSEKEDFILIDGKVALPEE